MITSLSCTGIKRDGTEQQYTKGRVWQPIRGEGASFKVEANPKYNKRGKKCYYLKKKRTFRSCRIFSKVSETWKIVKTTRKARISLEW